MDIRESLPVHAPTGAGLPSGAEAGGLRVSGLVERETALTPAMLNAITRDQLSEPFACEEGWVVEGLRWEGAPLRAVVSLCRPRPDARYVQVSAGAYSTALALDDLDHALLCDRLNGAPLTPEHGAPWRLIISGGACFTSVKWVSALEFTASPGETSAERIARGRIAVIATSE